MRGDLSNSLSMTKGPCTRESARLPPCTASFIEKLSAPSRQIVRLSILEVTRAKCGSEDCLDRPVMTSGGAGSL
jgi:hypothetical protein